MTNPHENDQPTTMAAIGALQQASPTLQELATTLDQNWAITGNNFGSTVAADKLTFRGAFLGNAQAFSISGN